MEMKKLTIRPIQRFGNGRLGVHAGSDEERGAEQAYGRASDDPFLQRVRIYKIGHHAGRRAHAGHLLHDLGVCHYFIRYQETLNLSRAAGRGE